MSYGSKESFYQTIVEIDDENKHYSFLRKAPSESEKMQHLIQHLWLKLLTQINRGNIFLARMPGIFGIDLSGQKVLFSPNA